MLTGNQKPKHPLVKVLNTLFITTVIGSLTFNVSCHDGKCEGEVTYKAALRQFVEQVFSPKDKF